ncbi:MAG: CPBP family intramembrane metalloprotease [Clostridia bacterium]|nr:CPBP family intramembrane metalloprotease [Clostridia bacterium]
MKKLYQKKPLLLALILIGIYVVLFSLSDNISTTIGVEKIITAPFSLLFSFALLLLLTKSELLREFGLCKIEKPQKSNLFYLPLFLIILPNLVFGFNLTLSPLEALLGVVTMLMVGFLEEVIFRGFLFKALCKDNLKTAVIISSVTFGFGHIINLLNGAEFFGTLLQIFYATAIGFLFTIIFHKTKSLWPCIITHSAVNSLSVFLNAEAVSKTQDILIALFLCVVPILYSIYIIKQPKTNK